MPVLLPDLWPLASKSLTLWEDRVPAWGMTTPSALPVHQCLDLSHRVLLDHHEKSLLSALSSLPALPPTPISTVSCCFPPVTKLISPLWLSYMGTALLEISQFYLFVW